MPLYRPGQEIVVHHGKPWKPGPPIRMPGVVASFEGKTLLLTRRFRSPGRIYDGLHAVQEAGDHGTIELRLGSWVCRRRYFRQDGRLIGERYNIQTPTQFLPRRVRYIDLGIDVAWRPHHAEPVEIQELADLKRAEARGHIPGPVADVARSIAEELAQRLRAWDGQEAPQWDIRPESGLLEPSVAGFIRHQAP